MNARCECGVGCNCVDFVALCSFAVVVIVPGRGLFHALADLEPGDETSSTHAKFIGVLNFGLQMPPLLLLMLLFAWVETSRQLQRV